LFIIHKVKDKFSFVAARLDTQWDAFVDRSPDGTIFSESVYLAAVRHEADCWYVVKGDQVKAGVLMLKARDGSGFELDDDVIYGGLMFAPVDEKWKQNRSQILSIRYQITEFTVAELTARAKKVQIALAPGIDDIRPFLWHCYHDPDPAHHFYHDLRYTSVLRIDSILQTAELATPEFQALGSSRKQEIRYARKDNVKAEMTDNVDEFLEISSLAAGAQGRDFADRRRAMKPIIENLLAKRRGILFGVFDSGRRMISGAYFCFDGKRAYYLYGANHPELRDRYSGTIVLWDAFLHLRRMGYREIDLEGINSPKRGWFKMSFGGELRTYHQLTLNGGAVC